jgi:hypothetical protein
MSMGSGAADGLQEVLQRLFLEAQFKQSQREHADRQGIAQQELGLRGRGLDIQQLGNEQDYELGQGNLALGGRRIDQDQAKLGEDVRQFDALAPKRDADVAHMGALTGEVLRKPLAEQEERTFTTGRDKTLHGYRIGETAAEGAEQRRTLGMRQGGGSAQSGDYADLYGAERGQRMRDAVDELLPLTNNKTVGWGSLLKGVPTSDALNYKAKLDSLKANVGFNEITEMRQASKTGGALGQVSDKEISFLQSSLAALDQAQTPDQVRAELTKVTAVLDRWEAAKAQFSGGGVSVPPRDTGGGPKVGEERMINGKPGRWDGKGWLPVQR